MEVVTGAEAVKDCNCLIRYRHNDGSLSHWGQAVRRDDGRFCDPNGLLIAKPDEYKIATPGEILAEMSGQGWMPCLVVGP